MKNLLSTITLLTGVFVFQSDAQELPKAEKYEGVDWYECDFTKFNAGKAADAVGIIENHFIKVDEKIGRKVLAMSFSTGDWDHMACFPLAEGPSAFEWKVRTDGEKFWGALAEQEGGAAAAHELMARYREMIAAQKTELARLRP